MGQKIPQHNVFAVIDLGSNSFHMQIAKNMAGGIHTIGRVKRKVRLAAGLNEDNVLSEEAMSRGWECLALFAERLQDIPRQNISIVATATLRLAINADEFIVKAEQILNHTINVISGELEARTIYKGVAHTSACQGRQLVIDIGGASTEIVIGKGFDALLYKSLNMGCVTYLERYFSDGLLSNANFNTAIAAAQNVLKPIKDDFIATGWELAIGASGTVQAIQEILAANHLSDTLTLQKLEDIQHQAMQCKTIADLDIAGLSEERRLVFVSGLAILIALFKSLNINKMGLAGGALREGVLYSMVPEFNNEDICKRTLDGFIERYHVDKNQANRVSEVALLLADQVQGAWLLHDPDIRSVLSAVTQLHEIGLIVDYKLYHNHSAYILQNTGMPGFTKTQKQMIVALTSAHRADIDLALFSSFSEQTKLTTRLAQLVRLAVILSMRRQNDVLPKLTLTVIDGEVLCLQVDPNWLALHPLMAGELHQEVQYQRKVGWQLSVNSL